MVCAIFNIGNRGDNLSESIYIDILIDNKFYHIQDSDKINDIIRITRYWPINNYSNSIIDGTEYLIKIMTNGDEIEYKGKGIYPKGYQAIINIIGDSDV